MAADDWAVVVGLTKYPGLTDLDGPENDVEEMYQWLIDPNGGAVPEDQIAKILSSQFPPAAKPSLAEPTTGRVENAFRSLMEEAEENEQAGNGKRTGRRLYIYMSGHGCAPRFEDAALLTADATKTVPSHVLGKLYANWFLRSNFFEEAVLFMDCCRESYPKTPPHIPTFVEITGPEGVEKARSFFGFGTKWAQASRERTMDDGKVHGVFTWALIKGLRGEAADPESGHVTAATLGNYLYNNMKSFLKPDDLEDPEVPKEPDLEYDNNPNKTFVFAQTAVQAYAATVALPPGAGGRQLQVLNSKFAKVESVAATPPVQKLMLKRGTYLVQVADLGLQGILEVKPTGVNDVSLV